LFALQNKLLNSAHLCNTLYSYTIKEKESGIYTPNTTPFQLVASLALGSVTISGADLLCLGLEDNNLTHFYPSPVFPLRFGVSACAQKISVSACMHAKLKINRYVPNKNADLQKKISLMGTEPFSQL